MQSNESFVINSIEEAPRALESQKIYSQKEMSPTEIFHNTTHEVTHELTRDSFLGEPSFVTALTSEASTYEGSCEEIPLDDATYGESISFEDFDTHHAKSDAQDHVAYENPFFESEPNDKFLRVEENFDQDKIFQDFQENSNPQNSTPQNVFSFNPLPIETSQSTHFLINWQDFLSFCEDRAFEEEYMPYLRHSSAQIFEKEQNFECVIRMPSEVEYNQIAQIRPLLEKTLREFLGNEFAEDERIGNMFSDSNFLENILVIRYNTNVQKKRSLSQMMEEMHDHPQIILLQKELGASLLGCHDVSVKHR